MFFFKERVSNIAFVTATCFGAGARTLLLYYSMSTAAELPANVDFALLHRVRKICLSTDKKAMNQEDADHVLRKLCKNKIYDRKLQGCAPKVC